MYSILNPNIFRDQYADSFSALSPFEEEIPLLELSDQTLQEIYYYRWHVFCSHIKQTPDGFVVTEFSKDVPWAGVHNTIVCAAGHHLYEGRWLPNQTYLRDYAKFWFTPQANLRLYSCWIADAICAACRVWGDFSLAKELYEDLSKNFAAWKASSQAESGLYYQFDVNDGMELMISGHGFRPTINSYQYGDAMALAKVAAMLGKHADEAFYLHEAADLKEKIDTLLWDDTAQFYKPLSDTLYENNIFMSIDKSNFSDHLNDTCYCLADVREQIGFIPWYFCLPDEDKRAAWRFLLDKNHFAAPYGITTAERCHPRFMEAHPHECLWNGPCWPFATSQTLTALGNLLTNYNQSVVTKHDFFVLLQQYAASQFMDGHPFVDEDQDPFAGIWLAREKLYQREDPHTDRDRGIHYNHSTFCDLVLSGLVGIRCRDDNILHIDPLFDETDLDYLCADGIPYHGHSISVVWDKSGSRYGYGAGVHVFCDGTKLGGSPIISKLSFPI